MNPVRAQLAACFLCLLLVGISLDGLPDPPAVKPTGNLSGLVALLHTYVTLAASNHVREYSGSVLHFQANLVFEDEEPPFGLIVVSQATDASPPVFLKTTAPSRQRTLEDP